MFERINSMSTTGSNCPKCGAPLVMKEPGLFTCPNCDLPIVPAPANLPPFDKRFFAAFVSLLLGPPALNLLLTPIGISTAIFTFIAGFICSVFAAVMTTRRVTTHPVAQVFLALFLIGLFVFTSTFLQYMGCVATHSDTFVH